MGSDVTPLNWERQFKPFIYLNGRSGGDAHTEKPRLSAGPSLYSQLTSELAILIGVSQWLFALTTARILLLLAGLLAATLLLLAGLLTRVLVLLARVLVWVGHIRDLPC